MALLNLFVLLVDSLIELICMHFCIELTLLLFFQFFVCEMILFFFTIHFLCVAATCFKKGLVDTTFDLICSCLDTQGLLKPGKQVIMQFCLVYGDKCIRDVMKTNPSGS